MTAYETRVDKVRYGTPDASEERVGIMEAVCLIFVLDPWYWSVVANSRYQMHPWEGGCSWGWVGFRSIS